MRFTRVTWISAILVVAALLFAVALGGRDTLPSPTEDARARVRVRRISPERLAGEVRAGGFLRARADVTVSAERGGRVLGLPVAEGSTVEKGTVVADFDDTIVMANLERARTVVREALLEPNIPAADLARAQEQLRLATEELALRHPASPLKGVVEIHHVDEGEYVTPGTPLVDVIDAGVVILDVDVDAEAVGSLRRGQPVRVTVTALADHGEWAGKISRIASRASPRTRRFRVEVSIEAKDGMPRPGMHGTARFEIPGGAPAIYLPKAATRRIRGQTGVYVVVDGTARWRPVHVVEIHHRPDLVRVVGDELDGQTTIVVSGFSGLRDKAPVEVHE